jgi:NAD(P)-dependent dehydrogenase (short-subunit alcohol dehydrogenase family)
MARLAGKVAVVTGGGQGIGRATARMFAREGAQVAIAARTQEKLDSVAAEIEAEEGEVLALPTDVGSETEMKALFAAVQDRFGGLDVLVNNAGVGHGVPVDEVDMADYDRLLNTNLKGMYLGCQLAVPMMKARGGGSIINVSSVHGVNGQANNTVYAATKGGIIGCTRALAAELAEDLIRVNTLSPGAIWLERYEEESLARVPEPHRDAFRERFADAMREGHRQFQPLPIVGEVDDIAQCALFLAAKESRFITGQNIVVDGGLTTYLPGMGLDGQREATAEAETEMRSWLEQHG